MRISDDAEQSGAGGEVRFRRHRRRWSEARKRQIVTESYQPGISVSVVARRHDVNANLVFSWRRQYRELARMAGGFVPVVVSSTEGAEPAKLPPGGEIVPGRNLLFDAGHVGYPDAARGPASCKATSAGTDTRRAVAK